MRDIGGIVKAQGLLTQNASEAIEALKSIKYPTGSLNKYYIKNIKESKENKLKENKHNRKILN